MNKAVFFDRDGVINEYKEYVHKVEDFVFTDGIFDLCRFFQNKGFLLIIVTNQAGIGRGYYDEAAYYTLTDWMLKSFKSEGITISKVYFCPHHSLHGLGKYKIDCDCRKPKPKMIFDAKEEFNVDLTQSLLIGDKEWDIEAAINASLGYSILIDPYESNVATKADYCFSSIIKLLNWIEYREKEEN